MVSSKKLGDAHPKALWLHSYIQAPWQRTLPYNVYKAPMFPSLKYREPMVPAWVCSQADSCGGFESQRSYSAPHHSHLVASSASLFPDGYSDISMRCQLRESTCLSLLGTALPQPSTEHLSHPSFSVLLHLSILGAEVEFCEKFVTESSSPAHPAAGTG